MGLVTKLPITISIVFLVVLGAAWKTQQESSVPNQVEILKSWQGDYPLAQIVLLPEKLREEAVGFIGDARTFEVVWEVFKPGEDVPEVDFEVNLVLFARNTQFFNRIRIGRVTFVNDVAEILAMETISAMPIEDKVAMSLAVVPRQGINFIKSGDSLIEIRP